MSSNSLILRLRRGGGGEAQSSTDLRIIALAALTITFTQRGTGTAEYSTDRQTWQPFVSGQPTPAFQIGQTIYLRGNLSPVVAATSDASGVGTFTASAAYNVAGCPLSLLGANYELTDNVPQYAFGGLFRDSTTLQSARRMSIPSGAIGSHGCWGMFYGCTAMQAAPELPSTSVGGYGYYGMFYGCSSLVTAPTVLPAITVNTHSYQYMFYQCTSLVTAPRVLATTLSGESGMYSMFMYCTALEDAPELYPTAVVDFQYHRLFDGCSRLAELRVHFTAWTEKGMYYWLQDTAANGTLYCPASLPQEFGRDRIPTGWSVVNI